MVLWLLVCSICAFYSCSTIFVCISFFSVFPISRFVVFQFFVVSNIICWSFVQFYNNSTFNLPSSWFEFCFQSGKIHSYFCILHTIFRNEIVQILWWIIGDILTLVKWRPIYSLVWNMNVTNVRAVDISEIQWTMDLDIYRAGNLVCGDGKLAIKLAILAMPYERRYSDMDCRNCFVCAIGIGCSVNV